MLSVVMLSVVMVSVVMVSVVMLSVVMLSVVLLSVVMLSVVIEKFRIGLPVANTPAYSPKASVTRRKKFYNFEWHGVKIKNCSNTLT
jgi:hypothetical protein